MNKSDRVFVDTPPIWPGLPNPHKADVDELDFLLSLPLQT